MYLPANLHQYLVPVLALIFFASSRDFSCGKFALLSLLTQFGNSWKFRHTCFVRNSGTGSGTSAFFGGTRTIGVISALHMMNSRMEFMQCSTNGKLAQVILGMMLQISLQTYRHEFVLFLALEYPDNARCRLFYEYSSGGGG
jgi:hypothetical protein